MHFLGFIANFYNGYIINMDCQSTHLLFQCMKVVITPIDVPDQKDGELDMMAAPIKILHVDDEVDYLKTTKRILELQANFQVESVTSAEEAEEKLKKESFDVIVSDYVMKGKDGLQFLKELRERGDNTPFIIFTGKGREIVAIRALNLGADFYINKIGNPEVVYCELANTIRKLVKVKRADKILRNSEKLYRSVFENTGTAMCILKEDGTFSLVNRQFEELVGVPQEILTHKKWSDFVSKKDLPRLKKLREAVWEDDETIPESVECELVTITGQIINVLVRVTKLPETNETLCSVIDLTALKNAESALLKERKMLEDVTSKTGIGLATISRDFKILWANTVLKRFLGDVEGKTCYSTFNNRDSVCPNCGVKEIFETGKELVVHEQKVPIPQGEIWLQLIATPIRNEKGEIVAAAETSINITDKKQAEIKLKAIKKKFEDYLNLSRSLMVALNREGKVTYVNSRFCEVTGCNKDEAAGKDWFATFLPKRVRKKVESVFRKLISGEIESVEFHENPILTTHGEERIISWKNAILRDENGKIIGTLSSGEDITEQKEAEEKLNALMDELVLVNEKLNVVGRLTRHDVRNKLAIVANNLYLAKQALGKSSEALEYLESIDEALSQIESIFEFAKVYEKIGVEGMTIFDVGKTFDEAVMLFSGLKDVKLFNECHGVKVLADSLLRYLLYNLVDNSLRHGEKVTAIRFCSREDEDCLKIVYEDNGVGVSKDEKELIFKDGYGKNTGHGLYLIRKICETYGWTIQETGKHGKGAQFTITIPKNLLPQTAPKEPPKKLRIAASRQSS